jgi:hypothetical protein
VAAVRGVYAENVSKVYIKKEENLPKTRLTRLDPVEQSIVGCLSSGRPGEGEDGEMPTELGE